MRKMYERMEFLKYCEDREMAVREVGEVIVIQGRSNQGAVDLHSLKSLPENVKFENQGAVHLGLSLIHI